MKDNEESFISKASTEALTSYSYKRSISSMASTTFLCVAEREMSVSDRLT